MFGHVQAYPFSQEYTIVQFYIGVPKRVQINENDGQHPFPISVSTESLHG